MNVWNTLYGRMFEYFYGWMTWMEEGMDVLGINARYGLKLIEYFRSILGGTDGVGGSVGRCN